MVSYAGSRGLSRPGISSLRETETQRLGCCGDVPWGGKTYVDRLISVAFRSVRFVLSRIGECGSHSAESYKLRVQQWRLFASFVVLHINTTLYGCKAWVEEVSSTMRSGAEGADTAKSE